MFLELGTDSAVLSTKADVLVQTQLQEATTAEQQAISANLTLITLLLWQLLQPRCI
jgi:hypothetical protein